VFRIEIHVYLRWRSDVYAISQHNVNNRRRLKPLCPSCKTRVQYRNTKIVQLQLLKSGLFCLTVINQILIWPKLELVYSFTHDHDIGPVQIGYANATWFDSLQVITRPAQLWAINNIMGLLCHSIPPIYNYIILYYNIIIIIILFTIILIKSAFSNHALSCFDNGMDYMCFECD